ncbi:MAG: helix-turn-helix transcriptional regulator [Ignavibacteriales bacterium]|nr:helix-turn-helix transcriptional regulator [Ignavibacteriales bacterium]
MINSLQEKLKKYRTKNKLAQKEIAGLLNISREHYARIENANCIPSSKVLQKCSDVMNSPVYSIYLPKKSSTQQNKKPRSQKQGS